MKKKLVVTMLMSVLVISACVSESNNTVENSETTIPTESTVSEETEIIKGNVVDNAEVMPEVEVIVEATEENEVIEETTETASTYVVTEKYEESSIDENEVIDTMPITNMDSDSGDLGTDSSPAWTEEEIKDFWDDAEVIGGDSKPTTDGYGPGAEFEISPAP